MPDEVVLDEWTVVVRSDPLMSATAAARLRDLVDHELAVAVRRLSDALGSAASVELS
ncbi:MAG TPA: hypothetical protein VHW74_01185 [Mycobacteriales bacterium]|jgi:hypothetical protein|nr:hypothetical protein [Mycobacteriales bacterium]